MNNLKNRECEGRLKGFTLIELLIAMAIGSILSGLVISTFITINRVYQYKTERSEQNQRFINLLDILEYDFLNSEYVIKGKAEKQIAFSNENSIVYSFLDSLIIRSSSNQIDTFIIANENLIIKYAESSGTLVNQIGFEITMNNLVYPVTVSKIYSRHNLYNHSIKNPVPDED